MYHIHLATVADFSISLISFMHVIIGKVFQFQLAISGSVDI